MSHYILANNISEMCMCTDCVCSGTVLPHCSPVSFKVDLKHLRDTYKQLQRVLQPDRFSTKSEVQSLRYKSNTVYLLSLRFWTWKFMLKCTYIRGCCEIEKCLLLCNAPHTAIVTEICCMEPVNKCYIVDNFLLQIYTPFVQLWDG